ncbi:phosphonate transporter [Paraburkholderia sp. SUR17]|uniref:phosphonate transporter n=1 Tax=Paraburkholderia sp. SUR17 TaxID=3034358 RepID=UPI002407CE60|nr:phosphonate transporter [Paraburkholderia sp. SUR17]WEY37685.1 phosphonate transporter [Paraburkholderia sp. SUR17]
MSNDDYRFEVATIYHCAMLDSGRFDEQRYGVIGFDPDLRLTVYNATESRNAGLPATRILGLNIFEEVAPCMNNFMVAQRFVNCDALDETIPYLLTLRMRPTPARLRLLMSPDVATRFLLIDREVRN